MVLKVLGCSGGIGDDPGTTAFLIDSDILIDAGTGLGLLSLPELVAIKHIFLTHSHLDHIACLPLLLDSVASVRLHPLTVWGTEETLEILRSHIFNWKIWPDFSVIPDEQRPVMQYHSLKPGEVIVIDGRRITAIPAHHTVPAVGYHLDSGLASLIFTGDTTTNDSFWEVVNAIENLRHLIIETTFPDSQKDLAIISKHLCPSLLMEELGKLKSNPHLYISHLKPGEKERIAQEIESGGDRFRLRLLRSGDEIHF